MEFIIIYVSYILHQIQGKTIMQSGDTSILNIGQDIKELQKTTSENTCLVEQYFETFYFGILQMKHCREVNLKILKKNKEIFSVKSSSFLGVMIGSNLRLEVHIENACS